MASAISYELFLAKQGTANGLATLDAGGKLSAAQLPTSATRNFKGSFTTSATLITAFPTGSVGDYAYVDGTQSYWYWNAKLTTAAWTNQQITETAYTALAAIEKTGIPYIVTP